ncbi:chitin disaccharide deacetylase [Desulfovibrionales bacterium]
MKRLIVTADDFGNSHGVCLGIAEAMLKGVVNATSAMVCVPPGLPYIVRYAPRLKGRIGLHLQLTGGVPVLPATRIPTLVRRNGYFANCPADMQRRVSQQEIYMEWMAQLNRLLSLNIVPSHLDSHHHIHIWPQVFPVFCELARKLRIPARATDAKQARVLRRLGVPTVDACQIKWFHDNLSERTFMAVVDETFRCIGGEGTVELMSHPGYVDPDLWIWSQYVQHRELELRVLTSPEVVRHLAAREIALAGMSVLV